MRFMLMPKGLLESKNKVRYEHVILSQTTLHQIKQHKAILQIEVSDHSDYTF